MENFVNSVANDLMNGLVFVWKMMPNDCPDYVVHLLSWKLVEDAIWASQNIIKVLATVLRMSDFSVTDHHVWVSSKLRLLGFKVTKCTADWETTWENSKRPDQRVVHSILISWGLIDSYLLQTWLSLRVDHRVCLVDVATWLLNPIKLCRLTRLVIIA